MQTKHICLSNELNVGNHAEQVDSGRSAICTESSLQKSTICCKGLWTSRIPDMKCPVTFVQNKNQGHNMGRAMVTIFWDLGRVILVDFTPHDAICHHGMLTRNKEAIFEGSVVFA
jgi:hypothetical protein